MGRRLIDFAVELASAAGDLIARRFAEADKGVDYKADNSVVTATDRDAEALMREMIESRYPSHGIIGEEYGVDNPNAEHVWTLDPIDGTISFVAGVPLFGTLVGLMEQGRPIVGVIHQPVLGEMVVGDGTTTLHNGTPTRVRDCERLEDATLLTTDPNLVDEFQDTARFEILRKRVAMTRTWGDCYGYLLVATGRADIMADPIMNPWDLIPLIPIINGAGGTITDWTGGDAVTGSSTVAANRDLHPRVIEILA